MERLGRQFVSLWPVTDFPLSAHWLILPRVLKMKGGFQVRLTWTAFIWTVFVLSSLVGSASGPVLNPWRGLRPSPCSGWKGIGRLAALIGVCTCRRQPGRRLGSGASVCVSVYVCVWVCVCIWFPRWTLGHCTVLLAWIVWRGSKLLSHFLYSSGEGPSFLSSQRRDF